MEAIVYMRYMIIDQEKHRKWEYLQRKADNAIRSWTYYVSYGLKIDKAILFGRSDNIRTRGTRVSFADQQFAYGMLEISSI